MYVIIDMGGNVVVTSNLARNSAQLAYSRAAKALAKALDLKTEGD